MITWKSVRPRACSWRFDGALLMAMVLGPAALHPAIALAQAAALPAPAAIDRAVAARAAAPQPVVTPDKRYVGTLAVRGGLIAPPTPVMLAWKYQNERLIPTTNPTYAAPQIPDRSPAVPFQPAASQAATLPPPNPTLVPDVVDEPMIDTSTQPLSAASK